MYTNEQVLFLQKLSFVAPIININDTQNHYILTSPEIFHFKEGVKETPNKIGHN